MEQAEDARYAAVLVAIGCLQMIGDSIYTNPLMLGFAWQKGRVPLSHSALMRAIELNGVQVDNNKAAFEWGRRCAHDLAAVQALFKAAQVIEFVKKPSLTEMLADLRREPGIERQEKNLLGRSSMISAVHSTVCPKGPWAVHRVLPFSLGETAIRWSMTRG